jgi:hypothetical protein
MMMAVEDARSPPMMLCWAVTVVTKSRGRRRRRRRVVATMVNSSFVDQTVSPNMETEASCVTEHLVRREKMVWPWFSKE